MRQFFHFLCSVTHTCITSPHTASRSEREQRDNVVWERRLETDDTLGPVAVPAPGCIKPFRSGRRCVMMCLSMAVRMRQTSHSVSVRDHQKIATCFHLSGGWLHMGPSQLVRERQESEAPSRETMAVWFNRLTYAGLGVAGLGLIGEQVLFDGVLLAPPSRPLPCHACLPVTQLAFVCPCMRAVCVYASWYRDGKACSRCITCVHIESGTVSHVPQTLCTVACCHLVWRIYVAHAVPPTSHSTVHL